MAQTKVQGKADQTRGTTRVQLELPERSMARLLALKEKTEASSYAEVMKNALRLYEDVIKEVEDGNELLLKNEAGQIYPYRVFSLNS
jgi:hypothetical protein